MFLKKVKIFFNGINSLGVFWLWLLVWMPLLAISKYFLNDLSEEILIGAMITWLFSFMLYEIEFNENKERMKRKTANLLFLLSFAVAGFFIVLDRFKLWERFLKRMDFVPIVSVPIVLASIFILLFLFGFMLFFLKKKRNLKWDRKIRKPSALISDFFIICFVAIVIEMERRGYSFYFLFAAFIAPLIWIHASIRRFHDLNQSGRYCFGLLVPFYNIYLLYRLVFVRGTKGENTYGPDPLTSSKSSKLSLS